MECVANDNAGDERDFAIGVASMPLPGLSATGTWVAIYGVISYDVSPEASPIELGHVDAHDSFHSSELMGENLQLLAGRLALAAKLSGLGALALLPCPWQTLRQSDCCWIGSLPNQAMALR